MGSYCVAFAGLELLLFYLPLRPERWMTVSLPWAVGPLILYFLYLKMVHALGGSAEQPAWASPQGSL